MTSLNSFTKPQIHLLSADDLTAQRVSPISLWGDAQWRLENPTPGQPDHCATVNWNIKLPHEQSLLDPQWAGLLDSLRRFVWSLLTDPREGKSLKTTSMATISRMLAYLVNWMATQDFRAIHELDNHASWEYVEHVAITGSDKQYSTLHEGWVWQRLHILTLLYKQSGALRESGVNPMPEPPFDGRNPFDVAKRITNRQRDFIPPLPDAVALPIMTAAERLIGVPADDVIKLQDVYLAAYAQGGPGNHKGPGHSLPVRTDAARRAVSSFQFSMLAGESLPWHDVIDTQPRRGAGQVDFVAAIRLLIMDIRIACIIVLQSHVGLRISEVMGLKAGIDPNSGLPSCLQQRPSKTGLNTIFYLKSLAAKIHGRPVEWIVGARPTDSQYLPPPVRALVVLERLFRPWRQLGDCPHLIVSFCANRGLPKTQRSVGRPFSQNVNLGQKDFLRRYVDWQALPPSPELDAYRDGRSLRTHQWRKTFALYVIQVDSRMLPHISQHFKHLSLAMTEQGYIGRDPEIIEAMSDARTRLTVRLLYEAATGDATYAGNMAPWLEAHRKSVRASMQDKTPEQILSDLEHEVVEHDFRIWFADHGKCLIELKPESARCHQIAGTTHWEDQNPNFQYREPSVCVGCECFLIDRESAGFWRKRYFDNQQAVENAERIGRGDEFYVARQRARQAAAILHVLGEDVEENGHDA